MSCIGRVASGVVVWCVLVLGGAGVGFGQIVINEFIQNPDEVNDNRGEWFELYNTGTRVDINGWKLDDDATLTGDHTIDNGGSLWIESEGYLVLGINDDRTTNGDMKVDYEFSSFSLSNGSDKIILLNATNVEQDRVEYDDGATFPYAVGAAVALKSPDLPNNAGGNWC